MDLASLLLAILYKFVYNRITIKEFHLLKGVSGMEIGAIIGIAAFGLMALFAVLVAIISAISAVSGYSRPGEEADDQ